MDEQLFLTAVELVEMQTPPAIPAKPTILTATADADSIVLGWTENGTYDKVLIDRKSSGEYSQLISINGGIATYDDTTAVAGTTYTYRVRGLTSGYPSPYSNETSDIIAFTPHAISSDGSAGNYLTAVNPTSLAFTNNDVVIFGAWINMTNRVNDGFLGKLDTGSNIYYFGTDGVGKLDFVYYTGLTLSEILAASALSNTTKYFVLAWVDPATTSLNIQVNGGTPESMSYTVNTPFSMGSGDFFLGNDGLDNLLLNGSLDEVFVCKNPANLSDALTALNTTVYNSGNGTLYSALSGATITTIGLQNWWGLDEASGTRLDLNASVNLTANGTVAATTALVS